MTSLARMGPNEPAGGVAATASGGPADRRMTPGIDVTADARRVLASGQVREVGQLTGRVPAPEGRYAVLRIRGDLLPGALARGAFSVVVDGDVMGTSAEMCGIEVDGELVVLGKVHQAVARARRIHVGSLVSRSRLTAEEDAVLAGDLAESSVVVGDRTAHLREAGALQGEYGRAHAALHGLGQQLKLEQGRMDRLLKATRLSFDFRIGDIVRREGQRLAIDLTPFYKVVGSEDPTRVDEALKEFFAKAVVGLLTRTNRDFLAKSDTNRRTFSTAVRKLYDLVSLTREVDRHAAQLAQMEDGIKSSAGPDRREAFLVVGGRVIPDVDIAIEGSFGSDGPDTQGEAQVRCLPVQVRRGPRSGLLEIRLEDTPGEPRLQTVEATDLRNVTVRENEGRVEWQVGSEPIK